MRSAQRGGTPDGPADPIRFSGEPHDRQTVCILTKTGLRLGLAYTGVMYAPRIWLTSRSSLLHESP